MDTVYYFAYGSNMYEQVISKSRGIKYFDKFVGNVKGWSLAFNCPGANKYEPAFANIEKDDSGVVHGVIYKMSSVEFSQLVKTEGDRYNVIDIPASLSSGGDIVSRTLVSKTTVADKRPSYRYLNLLIQGARDNLLPSGYVDKLIGTEHEPTPPGYAFVCKLVSLYLRVRFYLQKKSGINSAK